VTTQTPITGDVWGDERERTRAFLLQEAERSLTDLLETAAAARQRLECVLKGVSESQARFKPASGAGEDAYSSAEVTRHDIHTAGAMAARIKALGLGEAPAPTAGPGTLGEHDGASLADLRAILAQTAAILNAAVGSITGRERLDTTAPHRLFGELNCRAWLRLMALHEEDHARQIEKVKSHEDYPAGRGNRAADEPTITESALDILEQEESL
jgi:hypothetical protein